MLVLQQNSFKRAYKKLHPQQKQAVNEAVLVVCENPTLGEQKKGDLASIFVYKFAIIRSYIYWPTLSTQQH